MKTNRTNKVISTLLLLAVVIVSVVGSLGQVVLADDLDTTVIITKIETTDELKDMTLEDLASGVPADWFSSDSKPLSGISFTHYKVSETHYDQMMANPGSYATAAQLTALGYSGTATGLTDVNGQISLTLVDGFYWIIENPNSLVTSSKAVPFGLALPFTDAGGTGYLETVHVYPKNVVDDEEPEIDKVVDKEHNDIGEVHTWTVGITVPAGIGEYEKFGFIDEIDSRLDWVGVDTVVVSAPCIEMDPEDPDSGLTLGADYIVEFIANGTGTYGPTEGKAITGTLSLYFTEAGRAKLAANDCSRIEISFDTTINQTAIMGQDIPNRPGLVFDNGLGNVAEPGDEDNPPKYPEDPDPVVNTGGKAFVKVSSLLDDEGNPSALSDAEFVIKNDITNDENYGKYVVVGINNKIDYSDDISLATVFISDEYGKFEIKGLEYGDYVLEEIKAPSGYALPTNPETDFTVDENSYYQDPTKVTTTDTPSDNPTTIFNKKITIPQTGGIGTLLFTITGAILMILAAMYYRKLKVN